MRRQALISVVASIAAFGAGPVLAESVVQVFKRSGQVCISSNGTPDHSMGRFPNRNNPHGFRAQKTELCVTDSPRKGQRAQYVPVTGLAVNGVTIRPGTADFYDSTSRRGHSRNPASGWRLEGVGAGDMLGLDRNLAHVDHRGIYHYHGVPVALTKGADRIQVGWAADGFEIWHSKSARSSWQLKQGTRPTAPGGRYDGTFEEDYVYVAGSGNLDECNGAMVNGTYTYFATQTYPFYPRCLYGTQITRMRGGRPG